jgi:hypothetical protein
MKVRVSKNTAINADTIDSIETGTGANIVTIFFKDESSFEIKDTSCAIGFMIMIGVVDMLDDPSFKVFNDAEREIIHTSAWMQEAKRAKTTLGVSDEDMYRVHAHFKPLN